jgi:S1-C subfamily serine protease
VDRASAPPEALSFPPPSHEQFRFVPDDVLVTAAARRGGAGISAPLAGVLAALALFVSACTGGHAVATSGRPTTTPSLPSASPLVPAGVLNDPVVEVVKRVTPAVANVTSSTLTQDPFGQVQSGEGVGTGFIIRSDGILVTNFHVVEGALNLKVTLPPPDSRSFIARVIGGDSQHDLAVLKIEATGLPTIALGSSGDVVLGERVIALGYALALPDPP